MGVYLLQEWTGGSDGSGGKTDPYIEEDGGKGNRLADILCRHRIIGSHP